MAWRGWFPVGDELTSGEPDRKEGVCFGAELPPDDPRVLAGTPLHGPNLFPAEPAALGPVVQRWMEQVTALGQAVLSGIALGRRRPAGAQRLAPTGCRSRCSWTRRGMPR